MSLPLPRSVAMGSDCELLVVTIAAEEPPQSGAEILNQLAPHLPVDIEIYDVQMYEENVKFEPIMVRYLISVDLDEQRRRSVEAICQRLSDNEPFEIDRESHKSGKVRRVNLTEFLEGARVVEQGIELEVRFVDGSSLKLGEMPLLFGLNEQELKAPITRKFIQWKQR